MSTRSGHTPSTYAGALRLRAVQGPYVDIYTVTPASKAVIGRAPGCEICLVHESVSRRHALLQAAGPAWSIADEGSSGGTFLNGIQLTPHTPTVIAQGDLLRVGPWTFRVEVDSATPQSGPASAQLATIDDTRENARRVEPLRTRATGLASRRLDLLTECLARLHAARTEADMAHAALDSALEGSGFSRGAVLLPLVEGGEVRVLAMRGLEDALPGQGLSRSLLMAASKGQSVELAADAPSDRVGMESIVRAGVGRALCVPVLMGEEISALLYLDARGDATSSPDLAPYCEALTRALGLAMAGMKRAEFERRHQDLAAQLQAARGVQEIMAPAPSGRVGPIEYAFRVEPGVFVAGDLFDLIELSPPGGPRGVCVCVGDVSGHGAGSGMLMALTQAHLRARLTAMCDLPGAVGALNAYLAGLPLQGRFVSLLALTIDEHGKVECVDAGHGHWHVRRADGICDQPGRHAAIPLGIRDDAAFTPVSFTLNPGDRLLVYSDGIIEQLGPASEPFGVPRLRGASARAHSVTDDVQQVFTDLLAFARQRAGSPATLDDDATLASLSRVI